jgi:hypothetical protein
MKVFQDNIKDDEMGMIYSSIPGGVSISLIVVILLFWSRLRRKAAE